MRVLIASIASLLLAAAPAAAEPVSETVTSGSVTATFTYEKDGDDYSGFHLEIVRDGAKLWDRDVPQGCKDPCGVVPAYRPAKQDSVRLRDLDADRDPEVIVDLFTGGAHCCTISAIYTFEEGGGKYTPLRHNWRDAGYRLKDFDKDGKPELRSRDARFGYLYSSYAESYMPVEIFAFRNAKLYDVTKRFKKVLRADARRAFRLYLRNRGGNVNVRGILAAYAADKYRLGQRKRARATLFRALERGDLDRAYPFDQGPFGRAFIERLDRFLKKNDYRG